MLGRELGEDAGERPDLRRGARRARRRRWNPCRVTFQLTFLESNVDELADMVRLAASWASTASKDTTCGRTSTRSKDLSMRRNPDAIRRWNAAVLEAQEAAQTHKLADGRRCCSRISSCSTRTSTRRPRARRAVPVPGPGGLGERQGPLRPVLRTGCTNGAASATSETSTTKHHRHLERRSLRRAGAHATATASSALGATCASRRRNHAVSWHELTVAPSARITCAGGAPAVRGAIRRGADLPRAGTGARSRWPSGLAHRCRRRSRPMRDRFQRTFGFYEDLAAVVGDDGRFHILPSGESAYPDRYAWCGNFQERRCTVRDRERSLLPHQPRQGRPHTPSAGAMPGDFRYGVAVVQAEDGRSTHISPDGRLLHGRWFVDLDVFHKGFARARDEQAGCTSTAKATPATSDDLQRSSRSTTGRRASSGSTEGWR